jgi:S-adenosylmethionine hydrolase
VTLTSDLGAAYAAQMKAALVSGDVEPSRIVDLTHELPAHGVAEAAFVLRAMARGFPSRTVHVVVVDPGVGGGRAPVVITTRDGPLLVGPDNGVLIPLAEEFGLGRAYRIDRARLKLGARVGTTFDGRDLFAPAAALLANGARPSSLGPTASLVMYRVPRGARLRDGARGEVLHVDRFGNLITSIPTEWVPRTAGTVRLQCAGRRPRRVPWTTSYESLRTGALGALGSSFGLVEAAVGQGRAVDRLRARVGSPVTVRWGPRREPRGQRSNSARPRKAQ